MSARLSKIHSASAMCPLLYVATERDALESLVKLIERYNPDILLGWEVEALSWGYIFQRAFHLGLNNFPMRISKVPHMQVLAKSDAFEKDDVGEVKVLGRNILDVWRIMRHEAGERFSIFFSSLYFFRLRNGWGNSISSSAVDIYVRERYVSRSTRKNSVSFLQNVVHLVETGEYDNKRQSYTSLCHQSRRHSQAPESFGCYR